MSPVAVSHLAPRHSFSHPKTPTEGDRARDIPRRPSPWHDLAHSLSELPSPGVGSNGVGSPAPSPSPLAHPVSSSIPSPGYTTPLSLDALPGDTPPLSSSQAMRDWERSTDFRRHQLIHTPPKLSARNSSSSLNGAAPAPKLEPERDKDGHIEYKLKLIDPSPDRFERLVTQMLWRLKQGRNEAIYEIGLAGLTRAEMDASLKTLELMASEVGATVIVLKEILLYGPRPPMRAFSTSGASTSSARSRSGSSTTSVSHDEHSGSLGLEATPKKVKKSKKNRSTSREVRPRTISSSSRGSSSSLRRSSSTFDDSPTHQSLSHKSSFDDSVPFHLELEDTPLTPRSSGRSDKPSHPELRTAGEEIIRSKKFSAKAARSAHRKEQRRLDLIRGDGTNPFWVEMSSVLAPNSSTQDDSESSSSQVPLLANARTVSTLPAQPSSLRLTSTTDSSPDDQFLADLWRLPLDNLSLSFADVCTVTNPSVGASSLPSSDSTDTEYALPLHPSTSHPPSPVAAEWANRDQTPPPSEGQRICVEALIVRKSGGEGWCEGEDDGWGFGEDDEEEEELALA